MTYDTTGNQIITEVQSERRGARIAFLTNGRNKVLLVEQTKFSKEKGQYVIEHRADKSKIERHVKWDDDGAIADAIRAALEGRL